MTGAPPDSFAMLGMTLALDSFAALGMTGASPDSFAALGMTGASPDSFATLGMTVHETPTNRNRQR